MQGRGAAVKFSTAALLWAKALRMGQTQPFVLLDDARAGEGAADALLYEAPTALFVATRPEEVAPVLAAAEAARVAQGGALAGYIAYEAGLALEPKTAALAAARSGANGPLVWLGLFPPPRRIAAADVPGWLANRAEGPGTLGPMEPQLSPGGYAQAFAAMREAIHAGDIYQANLTYPLAGSFRGDPVGLYAALRGAAAAGYGGLIFDGSHWLLSFSPELFVALNGAEAKVKPMKGTRPREADPAADAAVAEALAASVKDRAENLMIVDLMRNDLARVSPPGEVRVDALFELRSYERVHHLVSQVSARLRPDTDLADLLAAAFPPGSITGAPKLQAMQVIAGHEPPRGPWCGTLAVLGADGGFDASVLIRTLAFTQEAQGWRWSGRAGAGLTADSDPHAELAETDVKMAALRTALLGPA